MIQLVYSSAATVKFSPDDLKKLLTQSRASNSKIGVTGMLVYEDGSFLQALEGDPVVVQTLYKKIEKDPRHTNILLLHKGEIKQPNFEEWSMGFVNAEDEPLDKLPGFTDFFGEDFSIPSLRKDAALARRLLAGFREGRWRQRVEIE